MNVLFASAGRRNELISYFRSVPEFGKLCVCDMDRHAVAFNEGDVGYLAPPIRSDEYPDFLIDLCRRESIRLVITLNDHELPLLAQMKSQLAEVGATALVSDPNVIETCWDKQKTDSFLRNNSMAVPKSYSIADVQENNTNWPLVIKPRFGTASLGVDIAQNAEEFDLVYRYAQRAMAGSKLHTQPNGKDLLIQQAISGTEFTIDVINDLGGQFHGCVVKERLRARGGDAACVVTRHDAQISQWCEKFSAALGHIGNADLDVIRSDQDGRLYCLDINPRFGGAYPFSYLSGVNLPQMLAAWLENGEAEKVTYKAGTYTARTEHYTSLRNVNNVTRLEADQPVGEVE